MANYMNGAPGQILTVKTAAGPINVNAEAAPAFQGFINDLVAAGAPITDIGSYNDRNIAGSTRRSQHAYGNAVDLDQSARNVVSPAFQAWANQNQGLIHQIGARYGIISGGDFSNPDFGHFEFDPRENGGRESHQAPPVSNSAPPATGNTATAAAPAAAVPQTAPQGRGSAIGAVLEGLGKAFSTPTTAPGPRQADSAPPMAADFTQNSAAGLAAMQPTLVPDAQSASTSPTGMQLTRDDASGPFATAPGQTRKARDPLLGLFGAARPAPLGGGMKIRA